MIEQAPPYAEKQSVTIVDVARRAGYSHSTVSRVLNDHPNVKEETRAAILHAVDELGYVANLQARSLAGGRLGVIGLVVLHLESTYMVEIVRSIDQALADAGYDFMLCTTYRREQGERSYVGQLSGGMVDGLIVILPVDAQRYAEELSRRNFPFVLLDHGPHELASSVAADNDHGVTLVVEHLRDLGHRRVACITGDVGLDIGRSRRDSFSAAAARFGLDTDPALVIEGDFGDLLAAKATMELMELDDPPTAIFASADTAAFGVFEALNQLGLQVPGDVSVVGFDDIPEAAVTNPPLTTVQQPFKDLGFRAVEHMLRKIDEPAIPPTHIKVPVSLVVRESTGPAQTRRSDDG